MLIIIAVCDPMLPSRIHNHISPCDSVRFRIFLYHPNDLVESLLGQLGRNKDDEIGLKGLGRLRRHNKKSMIIELVVMRGSTQPSLGLALSGTQGPRGDICTTLISGVSIAPHHLRHLVQTLFSDFVRLRKSRRERQIIVYTIAELLHLTR